MLPFLPVDGPDNQYGQIHTPMKKNPYQNAGLKGFEPCQPYKTATAVTLVVEEELIRFPTLAELNEECFEWEEGEEDLVQDDESLCTVIDFFCINTRSIFYCEENPSATQTSTSSVNGTRHWAIDCKYLGKQRQIVLCCSQHPRF